MKNENVKINNALKLIIAVVVSELAGVIGSVFTAPAISSGWYANLAKPALNPPARVFGPVWTTLYALMGIALWLVWKDKNADPRARYRAYILFSIQLVLNALWPIIFFDFQSIGGGLWEILALWVVILLTIIAFAKIFRPAAWLFVPYILWVSFAAYLNYSIWILN